MWSLWPHSHRHREVCVVRLSVPSPPSCLAVDGLFACKQDANKSATVDESNPENKPNGRLPSHAYTLQWAIVSPPKLSGCGSSQCRPNALTIEREKATAPTQVPGISGCKSRPQPRQSPWRAGCLPWWPILTTSSCFRARRRRDRPVRTGWDCGKPRAPQARFPLPPLPALIVCGDVVAGPQKLGLRLR